MGKIFVAVRARAPVTSCAYIFVFCCCTMELDRIVSERSRDLCRSTLRLILGVYERLHSPTHGCKVH